MLCTKIITKTASLKKCWVMFTINDLSLPADLFPFFPSHSCKYDFCFWLKIGILPLLEQQGFPKKFRLLKLRSLCLKGMQTQFGSHICLNYISYTSN